MPTKMRQFLTLFSLCAVLFVGFGCSDGDHSQSPADHNNADLYNAAVADAVFADSDEIYPQLTAITADNTDLEWRDGRVLVVTFTRYPDSYPEGETIQAWWGETWVTVVPELSDFYAGVRLRVDDPLLRIEQVLGLPEGTGNTWFAEMWVYPSDLYRPCPDNEITDSVCELTFPDAATSEHQDWFNAQITKSYFQEHKFPWTRLGYTYDWGNPHSAIGLSEFIVKQDAEVVIEKVARYDDYLLETPL